jgi:hypothetical protein
VGSDLFLRDWLVYVTLTLDTTAPEASVIRP